MYSSLAPIHSPEYRATLLTRLGVSIVFGLLVPIAGRGQIAPRDLTQASLEDLMNLQVTSVSKKEQKLSKAGAAVYVITQEDVRRSGATNIPDLLRMVPGVDVARLDANRWAVSIRGFNYIYADKVLVLIDGRTVYLDSASNVFWDQQDVPLEDIDHIEVIRGPGGTVWGANAVNGVINIITKNAKATQGGLVTAGSGSEETAEGLVQYGGKIGSKGAYRAFGRYFNINNTLAPGGQNAADGWHISHGGFRSDWDLSRKDSLTVQGDLYGSEAGQTITTVFSNALPRQGTLNDPLSNATGNILGRWNHTLTNGSDTSLQVFYDFNHRAANAFDYFVDTDGRPLIWRLRDSVQECLSNAQALRLAYPTQGRDTLAAGLVLGALGVAWMFLGRALVPRWVLTYSYTGKGGIPIWTFGMDFVMLGAGILVAAMFPGAGDWFRKRPGALVAVAIAAVIGWLVVCARAGFLID